MVMGLMTQSNKNRTLFLVIMWTFPDYIKDNNDKYHSVTQRLTFVLLNSFICAKTFFLLVFLFYKILTSVFV